MFANFNHSIFFFSIYLPINQHNENTKIPTHLSFESLPLLRNDDREEKKDRGALIELPER